jgi:hypothetical protein
MNPTPVPVEAARIAQAHALYCQLTGQTLSLRFERERMWYELLQTGVSLDDLRRVIRYLQREIREGRRYVGALKLSNLLQPDRFEEDLHISRVRLHPQPHTPRPTAPNRPPPLSPQLREQARQRALTLLRQFKSSLR